MMREACPRQEGFSRQQTHLCICLMRKAPHETANYSVCLVRGADGVAEGGYDIGSHLDFILMGMGSHCRI